MLMLTIVCRRIAVKLVDLMNFVRVCEWRVFVGGQCATMHITACVSYSVLLSAPSDEVASYKFGNYSHWDTNADADHRAS
jgi:hypothetical protein